MARELNVRWHDQRNNLRYPYGTCNATSIATVMQWMGIEPPERDRNEQLDDYVTRQLETDAAQREHQRTLADWRNWNPRNNHYVLKWYMEKAMGVKDDLIISNVSAYFDRIKASIDKGMPVICAGNYTRKRVNGTTDTIGHINVVVGYTDTGFIFCDPFGNAMSQYQDTNGNHVEYPYQFCQNALNILHILTPDITKEVATKPSPAVYQPPAGVEPQLKLDPIETRPAVTSVARTAVASQPVASNNCYLMAEGDSWFDYQYLPGGQDVVSQVQKRLWPGAAIHSDARAGSTLEHMMVGIRGEKPSLKNFIAKNLNNADGQFADYTKILLFSGGGNDVGGDSMLNYLNNKNAGLPLLRKDIMSYMINTVFRNYYTMLIDEVSKHNKAHIITHGYGYMIPTGIGHQTIPNFNFAGPWLLPAFQHCNITNSGEQRAILDEMIDSFNEMLLSLSKTYSNFHYIDLRKMITDNDWVNEIHLKPEIYGKVADRFVEKIREIQAGST